ncbi:MAG TPA: polymer-forming cytoskeletal protein [Candidatus Polarisedimenticolia bacterium]|nr:polymer-forming cytoskeletal protein [Candidatus Polarisedimenticolia bacterium]
MWRKSSEVNPSSPAPAAPAKVSAKPQETPQVTSLAPAFPAPATQTAPQASASGASKIGSGLRIRGEFSGNSDLYIDGDAQGKIRLAETRVTVGPNGRVQADIEAREIFVEGVVQGNLKASECVRLGATGRLQGTIIAPRVGIDDGAQFRGKVEVTRVAAPSAPPAVEPAKDAGDLHPVSAHAERE